MAGPDLTFLVLKGQIDLKAGGTNIRFPPRPDRLTSTGTATRAQPIGRHDAKHPRVGQPKRHGVTGRPDHSEVIEKYQTLAKDRESRTVLDDLLAATKSERETKRAKAMTEFAVFGFAAINDIDRLLQALNDPKQAEARRTAVVALRHWIGDAAGHDRHLHQFLVDRSGFSSAGDNRAAIVT